MRLCEVNWEPFDISFASESDELIVFYGDNTSVFPFHWPEYLTAEECGFIQPFSTLLSNRIRGMARALLRYYCSVFLQVSPVDLCFRTSDSGKLFLPDGRLHFNISHTGSSFLVCISTQYPVGIDLEIPVFRPDLYDVMTYAYSASEIDYVVQDVDITTRFFTIWTAKEAFLKAKGIGLMDGLKGIDLFSIGDNASVDRSFRMLSFLSPGGEISCLGTENLTSNVRFISFFGDSDC